MSPISSAPSCCVRWVDIGGTARVSTCRYAYGTAELLAWHLVECGCVSVQLECGQGTVQSPRVVVAVYGHVHGWAFI